jgi:hypothetical protein
MDSIIAAAARALAKGDALGARQRVALRGIAMAQLGELAHAHVKHWPMPAARPSVRACRR